MPCPTCDHTLEMLYGPGRILYYCCSRCGTMVEDERCEQLPYVPELVERCRRLVKTVAADAVSGTDRAPAAAFLMGILHQVGITEACLPVAERPTVPPGDEVIR